MEPFSIVVAIDEPSNVFPQVFNTLIFSGSNLFPLQRSKEAFTVGIVTRVGRPADACDDAVFTQRRKVTGIEILRTPIRVMHQPWPGLSILQCIRQSRERKPGA